MHEGRVAALRWIDDAVALRRQAASLVIGSTKLRDTDRIQELTEDFLQEQELRVVFESNHLEGAGPTTLTETRKIAKEALGHRRLTPMSNAERRLVVHRVWATRSMSTQATFRELAKLPPGITADLHLPVLTFEGRSRLGLEVIQHATAVERSLGRAKRFNIKRMRHWLDQHLQSSTEEVPSWPSGWPPRGRTVRPRVVDQTFVKDLHRGLARGLLDTKETEGVLPGEYRVDRRGAGPLGSERWFLPPGQLEPAMRVWVRRANTLALGTGIDPLFRACWIMHRFTEIHPFPDFNGRVARLLMNLSLAADGLPFPVSFPIGAKWRRRYGEALKAGDRADLEPLMTLVAKAIVDAFERFDGRLRSAGLTGIPKGKVGRYSPLLGPGNWGWRAEERRGGQSAALTRRGR